VKKVIVVRKALIVSNMIELVEGADSILQNL